MEQFQSGVEGGSYGNSAIVLAQPSSSKSTEILEAAFFGAEHLDQLRQREVVGEYPFEQGQVAGVDAEALTHGFTRLDAEKPVEPQQGAAHNPTALFVQTIAQRRRQQDGGQLVTKVVDVNLRTGGSQLQDEGQVRRLARGQHHGVTDVIPQLDGESGIDVEPITPLAPGAGRYVAL